MVTAVQEGYATASTDTGHRRQRAVRHRPSGKARGLRVSGRPRDDGADKALITKFYDRGPRLSYRNGCSTGGRQGLMEAQKY
jgi:feruloyl esterase